MQKIKERVPFCGFYIGKPQIADLERERGEMALTARTGSEHCSNKTRQTREPETLRQAQKGTKSQLLSYFLTMFSPFVRYIWPLAGPNIAKKDWPLQKLARVDRQTHFETFNFWVKPEF